MDDIIVIHRPSKEGHPAAREPIAGLDASSWVLWKTCLRQIAIGFNTSGGHLPVIRESDEIFRGPVAYKFLLEVACGLHSPVVGETEVLGQFKELIQITQRMAENPASDRFYFQQILRMFQNILTDTKVVRDSHLRDLGSRSYGSLLRRYVKGSDVLHVIGGGKLVREILPWLYDKVPQVDVYCRREAQGQDLQKEFPKIQVRPVLSPLEEGRLKGTLVIAAPMESAEIEKWLKIAHGKFDRVVDLRDDSDTDVIELGVPVLKLHEFFSQMEGSREESQLRLRTAKAAIEDLTQKRFRSVEIRPFGWEDLCG